MPTIVAIWLLCLVGGYCLGSYSVYKKKKEEERKYYTSAYYIYTNYNYDKVKNDKGLWGEYQTYLKLKWLEMYGARFLYNVYLPKEDGTTTEIDQLLLTTKGIFVIESKNYSGYIYGDFDNKHWFQKLGTNSIPFYNPIMQNEYHIKYLKKQLNTTLPIYSMIVFSERCTLKHVPDFTCDTYVIKRQNISDTIRLIIQINNVTGFTHRDVDDIQKQLFLFSQKTDEEKLQHVKNIKNSRVNKTTSAVNTYNIEEALKNYRKQKSRLLGKPAYCIFTNDELDKLMHYKPKSMVELYGLKILPRNKVGYYGREIIEIINKR